MYTFFRLAWRNLWRNKRRTFLTGGAIAFGLVLLIFAYGILDGYMEQMIETKASTLYGDLLIQRKGYHRTLRFSKKIESPVRIEAVLASDQRIAHWSTRILSRGTLSSAVNVRSIHLVGVDFARDQKMLTLYRHIQKGGGIPKALSPTHRKSHPPEILIGGAVAEALEIGPDQQAVLRVMGGQEGQPTDLRVRVAGIYRTGDSSLDGFYIFMPRRDLAQSLQLGQSAHQIAIRVRDRGQLKEVVASLTQRLPQAQVLEILPWWEYAPEIKSMIEQSSLGMYFFLFLIFVLVLFGTLNTTMMSTFERTRELGIMRALGTKPNQILWMICMEAIFLTAIFVCVGGGLGAAFNALLEASGGIPYGRWITQETQTLEMFGVAMEHTVPIKSSLRAILLPTISILFVPFLAALYPAWKASRIKPVEAIQFS